jgi:hypothetical protein
MKKVILIVAALGLAALMVTDVQAFSWPGRRGGRRYVRPAPVAAAQVQPGVRAYSYQPAPAAPVYRTYRANTGGPAYTNANNKALGRGF